MKEVYLKTTEELRTLNGMNSTKIGGILMLFVSLFFYIQSEKETKLHTLAIVGIALAALWLFYTIVQALILLRSKGIRGYIAWEIQNLSDALLIANVKMMWQFLLIFGLGLVFMSENMYAKKKETKNLGYAAIGVASLYAVANLVIGLRYIGKW